MALAGSVLLSDIFVLGAGALILLLFAVLKTLRDARRQAEQSHLAFRHHQQRLREVEDRLELVLDHLPMALFAIDREGKLIFSKGKLQRDLGSPPPEAFEKSVFSAYADLPEFMGAVRKALAGEATTVVGEYRGRFCEVQYRPYYDEGGQIAGVIGVSVDITERKQAEDERARLLQREQDARRAAEAAQQRFEFLAKASTLLDTSLDYPTTLASMASLVVPQISDWCIIDVIEPHAGDKAAEPRVHRLVVVHADPLKADLTRELWRHIPPNRRVMEVLRTGKAQLIGRMSDDSLQELAYNAKHLKVLKELGFRSGMCVPFLARGRILGAITLVRSEAGVPYGPADLALAEDLAHRAAIAIDTAQLYYQAQSMSRPAPEG